MSTARPPFAADRASLARLTQRGVGMTLAGGLYWGAMAAFVAFAGWSPVRLAVFLSVATVIVYPLGYALNRMAGGDLLARGHPFAGMVWMLGGSQALGWPMIAILCALAPGLVPFALAGILGAHFVPFAWLYRFPAYAVFGVACVVVAAGLQAAWPAFAPLAISLSMCAAYLVAVLVVARANRRDAKAAC